MARKELIVPSGDFLALLSEAKANAAAPRRPVSPAALDMACDPVSRALGPRLESLGDLDDGSGKGLPRTRPIRLGPAERLCQARGHCVGGAAFAAGGVPGGYLPNPVLLAAGLSSMRPFVAWHACQCNACVLSENLGVQTGCDDAIT